MAGLSVDTLEEFRKDFVNDGKLTLAKNTCTKFGPIEICKNHTAEEAYVSHFFNHKIEAEGKPITNQKSSGRCWIFACLNAMRIPFMKKLNIEEFEFSQTYLFFWDKIERMNHLLHVLVEVVRNGEKPEGRLISHLLLNPTDDGGQWAMLVNIINKYGVMPKGYFPDTFNSEASGQMNNLINSYIRQCSQKIQDLFANGDPGEKIVSAQLKEMMSKIYRTVTICLGVPPKDFTWEYYDKDKKYHKVGPITPQQFYKEHVKSAFNLDDKICLVNDPRNTSPYNKMYTVQYLNNMVGGIKVLYLNLPISELKTYAIASIKENEAMWFGCDVGKHFSWKKLGIQDLNMYDHQNVFGYTPQLGLTKAQRLQRSESMMTHAMVITAVHLDENERPQRWRVENSWSKDGGSEGYLVMTDDWFSEFVFELVVDKKLLPSELLKTLEEEPTVLPAWDPMGTLAKL